MSGLPIISETRFLSHVQKFIVAKWPRGSRGRIRLWRFISRQIDRADSIVRLLPGLADEVHVAVPLALLGADRDILLAVPRSINLVFQHFASRVVSIVRPRQVEVALAGLDHQTAGRMRWIRIGLITVINLDVVDIKRVFLAVV